MLQAGTNTSVSGSGSPANPYVVSAEVPCATVRSCLSAGPGIAYDPASGVIGAQLSAQAGNNLVIRPDGLFVPTGAATITSGAGLTGNGSASTPVKANVGTWPYPCPVDTAGGVVVTDSTGKLRGEPRGSASFAQFFDERTYNDVVVPDPTTVVDTFSATVTNPSTCLTALVIAEQEVDIWLVLPTGAGAATGFDGDEMYYVKNSGTGTIIGAHSQGTKVLSRGTLAPGATTSVSFGAQVGRGSAGAYYYRIQYALRVLMIAL